MAEHLEIASGTKDDKYSLLYRQIESVIEGEATITDNLGGVTPVKKGESILVPAVITSMKAQGNATFMTATV